MGVAKSQTRLSDWACMHTHKNNLSQIRKKKKKKNQFLEGLVNLAVKFETDTMDNKNFVQTAFRSDVAYMTVMVL